MLDNLKIRSIGVIKAIKKIIKVVRQVDQLIGIEMNYKAIKEARYMMKVYFKKGFSGGRYNKLRIFEIVMNLFMYI
jgi:hypothetical protein